jgi:malonyl-CoA decarboxylase
MELPGLKTFVTLSPIPGLATWLAAEAPGVDVENDEQMQALAACYLTRAKRPDGSPLDPVARFHLGNGAEVHRVHARADTSEKGLRQSGGVMVNYLYDLGRVAQNHERFAAAHEIAASAEIRSQAAAGEKAAEHVNV